MKMVDAGGNALNVHEEGEGRPLVLVHGFPLDHTMWRSQIETFATTHRVIAPDLRGFGRSGPAGGVVTMEQFADDLAAMLDALGIDEPISLCGLSMGGYVALQFAHKHPGRLRDLILCDTRSAADSPEAAEGRKKLAAQALAEGADVVARAMLPKLFSDSTRNKHPELVESMRQVILATAPATIAAAALGMATRPDVTEWLADIRVPTLVIVGEHDVITPVSEMRGLVDAIPDSVWVEVPEAGHMSPLENPEVVNTSMQEFLMRGAPPAPVL